MNVGRMRGLWAVLAFGIAWQATSRGAEEKLPDSPVLMQALVDELQRAMTLRMEDLERPYFIQLDVDDSISYQISARYGALTNSGRNRSRQLNCQVRVGSFELDNTNFSSGGGFSFGGMFGFGRASRSALPLDDDALAIRQTLWRAADDVYKDAVETLTKKRSYMKDKTIADRPNDFAHAPAVEHIGPSAVLDFDRTNWERNLRQLSAHFKTHQKIQDSSVRLLVRAGNSYVVNSEGSRVRIPDHKAWLTVTAVVQAADGQRLVATRNYAGASPADFPPLEQIRKDIDQTVAELTAAMTAPVLEHYTGPVLFDETAAAQLFRTLLADGLAGRAITVGEERRNPSDRENLETKLGTQILPKSFQVWDDPKVVKLGNEVLMGHYDYDDEGLPAERVELIKNGKLEKLCMSRMPTKKLSGSNGHGRRGLGGGDVAASIGCLFIEDNQGVPAVQLKAALIDAAKEAGLDYGVRIKALKSAASDADSGRIGTFMRMMRGGGREEASLGEPVAAFKVFVADGHEEPFRGCEVGQIRVPELKRILASGDKPQVVSSIGEFGFGKPSAPTAISAPPVLLPEVELSKQEMEHDNPPILLAPALR